MKETKLSGLIERAPCILRYLCALFWNKFRCILVFVAAVRLHELSKDFKVLFIGAVVVCARAHTQTHRLGYLTYFRKECKNVLFFFASLGTNGISADFMEIGCIHTFTLPLLAWKVLTQYLPK